MIKYIQVALYLIISSWIQSIFSDSRPFSGSVRLQNGIKSQWGNIHRKWIFKTMSNFIGLFLPPQLNWFVTIIAKLHAFKSCSPVLSQSTENLQRYVGGSSWVLGAAVSLSCPHSHSPPGNDYSEPREIPHFYSLAWCRQNISVDV